VKTPVVLSLSIVLVVGGSFALPARASEPALPDGERPGMTPVLYPAGAKAPSLGDEGAPALSPDGKYRVLGLPSGESGYGGEDLYVSYKRNNGTWTEPVNLGALVNTAADETRPAVSSCGGYIFFLGSRNGVDGIYWVSATVAGHLMPESCRTGEACRAEGPCVQAEAARRARSSGGGR
jgi:hypothetical protein